MDKRQDARGNDTDSGSKAGDKRADSNGCSPRHAAHNAKGKGGGGVSEKRREQFIGGGSIEKETVSGNKTKLTQQK